MLCRHGMRFLIVCLMTYCNASRAHAQPPGPPVTVHESANASGWEVRVSFQAAPGDFARAAQAWTASYAKELASRFMQRNAHLTDGLAVAAIRIEGKDGNGTQAAA